MNAEYYIKCYQEEQMKIAKLNVTSERDGVIITFLMDEYEYVKKADNYFGTLVEIRKELELRNMKLLCKGCCRNVYPSPMSFDMCGGLIAYTMKMGEEVSREDKVNIFNDCTLEEYASVDEQLSYCKEWYEHIKELRYTL